MDQETVRKLVEILQIFPQIKNEGIILGPDFQETVHSTIFRENFDSLKALCQGLAKENKEIPGGYRIKFEPVFEHEHEDERPFEGLHLALRNKRNETIGILVFYAGMPMQIRFVQATREGGARSFYNETGKFFWEALTDRFIEVVHQHVPKERGDKIVFLLNAANMNPELKLAIARKYCPKTAIQLLLTTRNKGTTKRKHARDNLRQRAISRGISHYRMPVKNKRFSRLRRGLPLDKKPRHAPTKKPLL